MSLIQPKQLAGQFYNITGSFTGSFIGDGSGLTNLPITLTSASGFIFPESYGAIGNGIADDTSALQNAFNASRVTNIPICLNGIYNVNQPINATNTKYLVNQHLN
jgi:hypothetical protein